MRIGETISITLAGQEIVLRPTLREAMRLERRKGGLNAIGEALCEHSLEASCLLIAGHTNMSFLPNRVYDAGVEKLAPQLTYYLFGLMGADPDATRDEIPTARATKKQPMTMIDVLNRFYALGTGWLGWTPQETLDASPREIIAAYQGRLDMLRSIFGQAEAEPQRTAPEDMDAKVKSIFGRLGTVKAA